MKKDSLGDRQKSYERQYSKQLLPLIPICARIDGRAFHTFAKGLQRPYDSRLSNLMIETTKYLVKSTNAIIGYTQSDEISLIWFEESIKSEVFFDADHSKMVSILAAKTSNFFNKNLETYIPEKAEQYKNKDDNPEFDSRVWNVPTLWEAANYLIWRELDATRNSISMAAQAYYSHNQLHKKTSSQKQDMLFEVGVNWNNYPDFFKRGSYIQKVTVERPFTSTEIDKLPLKHEARTNPDLKIKRQEVKIRHLPPIRKIKNREEVLFNNKEIILKEE